MSKARKGNKQTTRKKKNPSNNSNYSSLAGEFAVLSQLALKGIDASLTLGNTKEVDILISNPKTNESKRLEVKTKTQHTKQGYITRGHVGRNFCEWQMGTKHEKLDHENLFYCFVLMNPHEEMKSYFFVVPSKIVASYVRRDYRLWKNRIPVKKKSAKKKVKKPNPMRMFRIGLDQNHLNYEKTKMETPLYSDYLNQWDLLTKERK